mgnify:CR=1 FL=1
MLLGVLDGAREADVMLNMLFGSLLKPRTISEIQPFLRSRRSLTEDAAQELIRWPSARCREWS